MNTQAWATFSFSPPPPPAPTYAVKDLRTESQNCHLCPSVASPIWQSFRSFALTEPVKEALTLYGAEEMRAEGELC